MPHQRTRFLLEILEKRLQLFPVVGVLGARQTGKSTLLRDLLPQTRKIKYVTLDRNEERVLAEKQPTLFIQNLEASGIKTVCIDEVQKAPVLFDTIKAEVDEKKWLGRFALSGSTEFSKKTGIKESLTGRIALLRIFPLNQCEVLQGQPTFPLLSPLEGVASKNKLSIAKLKDIHLALARGGMPGIFGVRDKNNREALFESWIETTCSRDLAQFKIPRFSPELARRILVESAKASVPSQSEIANAVGKTSRQIENYLQAFKALFVLYEVMPYKTSIGKPLFYVFDTGVAGSLGSDLSRRFQVWFLNECLSQHSYAGEPYPDIFYYESSKGSRIDFIMQSKTARYAIKLCDEEAPSRYALRAPEAFCKRHPDIHVIVAAPCLEAHSLEKNLTIVPWTALAG